MQVSSGGHHISPSTLLSSRQVPVPVPVPVLEAQHAACADFEKLCSLEEQAEQLQREITDLVQHRWPVQTQ